MKTAPATNPEPALHRRAFLALALAVAALFLLATPRPTILRPLARWTGWEEAGKDGARGTLDWELLEVTVSSRPPGPT